MPSINEEKNGKLSKLGIADDPNKDRFADC